MAFGNAITDFVISAPQGANGGIVVVSLLANRMRKVYSVQMQSAAGLYSKPVTAEVEESILYSYLADANAPDFAYAQTSTTLYIFVKTGVYDPTNSTVRVGIVYDRNAIPVTAVGSYRDIPQEARELGMALLKEYIRTVNGDRVELDVSNAIGRELAQLGLD